MPPKPSGSVRGRGRGRGAGAAGTTRATAVSLERSEPTPATEATTAPESIIPKTEDGDGAASGAVDLSATVDSQLAPDSYVNPAIQDASSELQTNPT
jgi:hypothetical protein